MAISVATTRSSKIKYVKEYERGDEPVKFDPPQAAEVVVRDWDVEDPAARWLAAEDQLGRDANDDKWYGKHAMWFIDSSRNAAVLIVFRPKVPVQSAS